MVGRAGSFGPGGLDGAPPDPALFPDWRSFATALSAFYSSQTKNRQGVQPAPVLLQHADTSGTAARAQADGLMLFDPVREVPVFSRGGAWVSDAESADFATEAGLAAMAEIGYNPDRIINGDFSVWQRGVSFTAAFAFTADRWRNVWGGTTPGSQSVTLQDFPPGTQLGRNSPPIFARVAAVTGTGTDHYSLLQQLIEDVRSYEGQTVTVLGWARRSSGSGDMAVEIAQACGSGGSSGVSGVGVDVALTADWEPFAAVIDVPSVTGQTIGAGSYLELNVRLSGGSDWGTRRGSVGAQTVTVDFWGLHIAPGVRTVADVLQYVPPSPAEVADACLRYYETGTFLMQSAAAGAHAHSVQFMTAKRGGPTMNFTVTSSVSWGTLTSQGSFPFGFRVNALASAVGGYGFVDWIADAEL